RGDRVGLRSDEDNLRLVAGGGKLRALGEKAVAGMDGVGAAGARGVDDAADVEVAADDDGLVEEAADEADVVVLGVREDGADAHLATGAGDADGDFAAVGDEDGVHECRMQNSECRIRSGAILHSEFCILHSFTSPTAASLSSETQTFLSALRPTPSAPQSPRSYAARRRPARSRPRAQSASCIPAPL